MLDNTWWQFSTRNINNAEFMFGDLELSNK
jgi:hypothetical protein